MITTSKNQDDFQKRSDERENQRQKRIAQNKIDTEPIIEDLHGAGFYVEWVSDLYNQKLNYKAAVPILLKWFSITDNIDVKQSLVRAMSVPWAKPAAAQPLLQEFRKLHGESTSGLKWAIANGLSVVADRSVLDEIVQLVLDSSHGSSRQMLALALGNINDPKSEETLIALLDDDEVAGHAIMGLGKLKSKKAGPFIERFRDHPVTWIRKEAIKALAKIERANR